MKSVILVCLVLISQVFAANYEIWAIDQAPTRSTTGGVIYVYEPERFPTPSKVIDTHVAAVAGRCTPGARPHFGIGNNGNNKNTPVTRVIVSEFSAGQITIYDVETKNVVGCVDTKPNTANNSTLTHHSEVDNTNSFILVADQSGYLHKIAADWETDSYTLIETMDVRHLNNTVGTAVVRPLCFGISKENRAYITLTDGGFLIVDNIGTIANMTIAATFTVAQVPPGGCMILPTPTGGMMASSESTLEFGDDYFLHFEDSSTNDAPVKVLLPGRNVHAGITCESNKGEVYAWMFARLSDELFIIDLSTNTLVKTHNLAARFNLPVVTPDIVTSFLPNGRMYIATRGTNPRSAINAFIDARRESGVIEIKKSNNCLDFQYISRAVFYTDLPVFPPDGHGVSLLLVGNDN